MAVQALPPRTYRACGDAQPILAMFRVARLCRSWRTDWLRRDHPPQKRAIRAMFSLTLGASSPWPGQRDHRNDSLTTPCGFGTSDADFFPVQNGPETVGLDGGDAVSAVGLRFGGIVTFCCSLSRLAAVQGSSLIVSLPRFVHRVEPSQYNTRREGNAGLFLATKTRQRAGARAALDPDRSRCWLALSLTG